MINNTKLFNRNFVLIMLANMLSAFSFYMISTLLSSYLTGNGIRLSVTGIIIGLFSIVALLFRPICGILSDSVNKVILLRISTLIMTFGLFGYIFTTIVPLLVLVRIIHGVGFAVCSTAMVALAADYIPKEKMGEGIGYLGLGQVVASAVAPGIGIGIADKIGMNATFITAGFMALSVFAITILLSAKNVFVGGKINKAIKLSDMVVLEALPYAAVAGVFSFMNGMVATYLVQYTKEMGISHISIYFTVCAVALFVIRPISGKIMDTRGLDIVVIPGIILACLSCVMLGSAKTLVVILLSGIIRSIGQGAAQPSLQAACINKAGKMRSGVAVSTFLLGGDIGQGISPMVGGYIAEHYNYNILFTFCAVLLFEAMFYYIWIQKRANKYLKEVKGKERDAKENRQ